MIMLIQLLIVFTCILEQFIVYIYTQLSVEDISHFCTNKARLTRCQIIMFSVIVNI